MAYAVIASHAGTVGTSAASPGVSITMPSGIVAGDLLLALVVGDGSASFTTPSGWTLLATQNNGTTVITYWYWKIAAGSDTMTLSRGADTNDFTASVLRITGHGVSTGSDIPNANATGSTSQPDPPSLTLPFQTDWLILPAFGADDDTQATGYWGTDGAGVRQDESATGTTSCMGAISYLNYNGVFGAYDPAVMNLGGAELNVSWTLGIPPDRTRNLSGTSAIDTPLTTPGTIDVVHTCVLSGTTARGGSGQSTYHFDASLAGPTDSELLWSGDANAFDGSTATTAGVATVQLSTEGLRGTGITAPLSGGAITTVEARVYGSGECNADVLHSTETLGTATTPAGTGWGAKVELSAPTGGWTWQKINDLEVAFYDPVGGVASVGRAEVIISWQYVIWGTSGTLDVTAGAGPQTVSPTDIASLEAFGTAIITTGAVSVAPTEITSLEAFSTHVLTNLNTVVPSSIDSLEAFGTHALTSVKAVFPTEIASLEAFGNATVQSNQFVTTISIDSLEAFGTNILSSFYPITLTDGIASLEAFGTHALTTAAWITQTESIPSAEAFGTPLLYYTQFLVPTEIASAEAFGTAVVTKISNILNAGEIPSAEGFGTPALTTFYTVSDVGAIATAEGFGTASLVKTYAITDAGAIATAEAFGTAALTVLRDILDAGGIASAEAFGTPAIVLPVVMLYPSEIASSEAFGNAFVDGTGDEQFVFPVAIVSDEAFGTLTVTTGAVTIADAGAIVSAEAVSTPSLVKEAYILTVTGSIGSSEAFGSPQINMHIQSVGNIASAESIGTDITFGFGPIFPPGIPSEEAFGYHTITGGESNEETSGTIGANITKWITTTTVKATA